MPRRSAAMDLNFGFMCIPGNSIFFLINKVFSSENSVEHMNYFSAPQMEIKRFEVRQM